MRKNDNYCELTRTTHNAHLLATLFVLRKPGESRELYESRICSAGDRLCGNHPIGYLFRKRGTVTPAMLKRETEQRTRAQRRNAYAVASTAVTQYYGSAGFKPC